MCTPEELRKQNEEFEKTGKLCEALLKHLFCMGAEKVTIPTTVIRPNGQKVVGEVTVEIKY